MNFLRTLQRIFLLTLNVAVVWLVYDQVFGRLDRHLPLLVALMFAYILSSYVLLPQLVHLGVMLFRRGRIPRVTYSADGLVADPVNIILKSTAYDLSRAFEIIGWNVSDPLTIRTSFKMVKCFILNTPYPQAPFSSLYLFGREQDFGFQEAIGNSPRKRNHVRFWAVDVDPLAEITNIRYWLKKNSLDVYRSCTWVGSASRDIGFGLTKFSYKISHKVDAEVDCEREYLLNSLKKHDLISNEGYVNVGELVVDKYVSDGKILWAELVVPSSDPGSRY